MNRLSQIAAGRDALLSSHPGLSARVAASREATVAALPELVARAKESLAGKLATVYEAKDAGEAAAIIRGLLTGKKVARAYSNTLAEIGFDRMLDDIGASASLTRLEEIVAAKAGLAPSGHPHLAALDLSPRQIAESLRRFAAADAGQDGQSLKELAAAKIKETILASDFGVTGANAVVADNGVLVLIEDEGNVRAVSNLPYRHIAVVGIDKINPSAEDAMVILQAAAIFGAGRVAPTYFSLIAGPSRTADIEFRMAYGMHGPKEVHVILLDNGRTALRDQDAGALLKCIDCGACYEACREVAAAQKWEGVVMTPKALALGLIRGQLAPAEGRVACAPFPCPAGITAEEAAEILVRIGA